MSKAQTTFYQLLNVIDKSQVWPFMTFHTNESRDLIQLLRLHLRFWMESRNMRPLEKEIDFQFIVCHRSTSFHSSSDRKDIQSTAPAQHMREDIIIFIIYFRAIYFFATGFVILQQVLKDKALFFLALAPSSLGVGFSL